MSLALVYMLDQIVDQRPYFGWKKTIWRIEEPHRAYISARFEVPVGEHLYEFATLQCSASREFRQVRNAEILLRRFEPRAGMIRYISPGNLHGVHLRAAPKTPAVVVGGFAQIKAVVLREITRVLGRAASTQILWRRTQHPAYRSKPPSRQTGRRVIG